MGFCFFNNVDEWTQPRDRQDGMVQAGRTPVHA